VRIFPPTGIFWGSSGRARPLRGRKKAQILVGLSGETLRKAAFVVEKKPEYKEKLLQGKEGEGEANSPA